MSGKSAVRGEGVVGVERAAMQRLARFGEMWITFDYAVFTALSAMTDDELRQTIKDTAWPSATNTWFAVYEAAPHVRQQAQQLLYAREREAAKPTPTEQPKSKRKPKARRHS